MFLSLESFGYAFKFNPCIFQITNKKKDQQNPILKKGKKKTIERLFLGFFIKNGFGTFLRGVSDSKFFLRQWDVKCFIPKGTLMFKFFFMYLAL